MKLELLPEAVAELNDSITFYEEQEPGLGERFFTAIVAAIELAAGCNEARRFIEAPARSTTSAG